MIATFLNKLLFHELSINTIQLKLLRFYLIKTKNPIFVDFISTNLLEKRLFTFTDGKKKSKNLLMKNNLQITNTDLWQSYLLLWRQDEDQYFLDSLLKKEIKTIKGLKNEIFNINYLKQVNTILKKKYFNSLKNTIFLEESLDYQHNLNIYILGILDEISCLYQREMYTTQKTLRGIISRYIKEIIIPYSNSLLLTCIQSCVFFFLICELFSGFFFLITCIYIYIYYIVYGSFDSFNLENVLNSYTIGYFLNTIFFNNINWTLKNPYFIEFFYNNFFDFLLWFNFYLFLFYIVFTNTNETENDILYNFSFLTPTSTNDEELDDFNFQEMLEILIFVMDFNFSNLSQNNTFQIKGKNNELFREYYNMYSSLEKNYSQIYLFLYFYFLIMALNWNYDSSIESMNEITDIYFSDFSYSDFQASFDFETLPLWNLPIHFVDLLEQDSFFSFFNEVDSLYGGYEYNLDSATTGSELLTPIFLISEIFFPIQLDLYLATELPNFEIFFENFYFNIFSNYFYKDVFEIFFFFVLILIIIVQLVASYHWELYIYREHRYQDFLSQISFLGWYHSLTNEAIQTDFDILRYDSLYDISLENDFDNIVTETTRFINPWVYDIDFEQSCEFEYIFLNKLFYSNVKGINSKLENFSNYYDENDLLNIYQTAYESDKYLDESYKEKFYSGKLHQIVEDEQSFLQKNVIQFFIKNKSFFAILALLIKVSLSKKPDLIKFSDYKLNTFFITDKNLEIILKKIYQIINNDIGIQNYIYFYLVMAKSAGLKKLTLEDQIQQFLYLLIQKFFDSNCLKNQKLNYSLFTNKYIFSFFINDLCNIVLTINMSDKKLYFTEIDELINFINTRDCFEDIAFFESTSGIQEQLSEPLEPNDAIYETEVLQNLDFIPIKNNIYNFDKKNIDQQFLYKDYYKKYLYDTDISPVMSEIFEDFEQPNEFLGGISDSDEYDLDEEEEEINSEMTFLENLDVDIVNNQEKKYEIKEEFEDFLNINNIQEEANNVDKEEEDSWLIDDLNTTYAEEEEDLELIDDSNNEVVLDMMLTRKKTFYYWFFQNFQNLHNDYLSMIEDEGDHDPDDSSDIEFSAIMDDNYSENFFFLKEFGLTMTNSIDFYDSKAFSTKKKYLLTNITNLLNQNEYIIDSLKNFISIINYSDYYYYYLTDISEENLFLINRLNLFTTNVKHLKTINASYEKYYYQTTNIFIHFDDLNLYELDNFESFYTYQDILSFDILSFYYNKKNGINRNISILKFLILPTQLNDFKNKVFENRLDIYEQSIQKFETKNNIFVKKFFIENEFISTYNKTKFFNLTKYNYENDTNSIEYLDDELFLNKYYQIPQNRLLLNSALDNKNNNVTNWLDGFGTWYFLNLNQFDGITNNSFHNSDDLEVMQIENNLQTAFSQTDIDTLTDDLVNYKFYNNLEEENFFEFFNVINDYEDIEEDSEPDLHYKNQNNEEVSVWDLNPATILASNTPDYPTTAIFEEVLGEDATDNFVSSDMYSDLLENLDDFEEDLLESSYLIETMRVSVIIIILGIEFCLIIIFSFYLIPFLQNQDLDLLEHLGFSTEVVIEYGVLTFLLPDILTIRIDFVFDFIDWFPVNIFTLWTKLFSMDNGFYSSDIIEILWDFIHHIVDSKFSLIYLLIGQIIEFQTGNALATMEIEILSKGHNIGTLDKLGTDPETILAGPIMKDPMILLNENSLKEDFDELVKLIDILYFCFSRIFFSLLIIYQKIIIYSQDWMKNLLYTFPTIFKSKTFNFWLIYEFFANLFNFLFSNLSNFFHKIESILILKQKNLNKSFFIFQVQEIQNFFFTQFREQFVELLSTIEFENDYTKNKLQVFKLFAIYKLVAKNILLLHNHNLYDNIKDMNISFDINHESLFRKLKYGDNDDGTVLRLMEGQSLLEATHINVNLLNSFLMNIFQPEEVRNLFFFDYRQPKYFSYIFDILFEMLRRVIELIKCIYKTYTKINVIIGIRNIPIYSSNLYYYHNLTENWFLVIYNIKIYSIQILYIILRLISYIYNINIYYQYILYKLIIIMKFIFSSKILLLNVNMYEENISLIPLRSNIYKNIFLENEMYWALAEYKFLQNLFIQSNPTMTFIDRNNYLTTSVDYAISWY